MHTLLLSTLLFHGLGTVAIVLGAAFGSVLPGRRTALTWELASAGAPGISADALATPPEAGEMEWPHAA